MSDFEYIDITKRQMFFFTLVILIGYGVALFYAMEAEPGDLDRFPAFSSQMVTLIGFSHAGYLAGKTASKTPVK